MPLAHMCHLLLTHASHMHQTDMDLSCITHASDVTDADLTCFWGQLTDICRNAMVFLEVDHLLLGLEAILSDPVTKNPPTSLLRSTRLSAPRAHFHFHTRTHTSFLILVLAVNELAWAMGDAGHDSAGN